MEKNIPFQVQNLINNLLNPTENVHIRGNYRSRLIEIREAVDQSIRKYDNEAYMAKAKRK